MDASFVSSKIGQAISFLTHTWNAFWVFMDLSFALSYFCFMCLLYAWISVCEHVLGGPYSYLWRWIRRLIWVLPVLFGATLLIWSIFKGFLSSNYFSVNLPSFSLVYIVVIPSLFISSLLMIVAATRVLYILRDVTDLGEVSNIPQTSLKRKIALACLADSLLNSRILSCLPCTIMLLM